MKRHPMTLLVGTVLLAGGFSAFAQNHPADRYLELIEARYSLIDDYQCRMREFSIGNGRREERIINYFFKKPKLIRMDILDGNRTFDRGSVGVYTGGDKVSGHRGGIMKDITLSISKNSALATSVRGETIDQSDMLTVIERFAYHVKNSTITVREKPSHIEFVFVPAEPSLNDGISRDIIWIDREILLVIRNERYEGNKLVQQVIWSEYILNAGLPLELFDPGFDIDALRGTDIPLLSRELEQ
jgi:outer membrane lipoprotein-sorting protein